MLHACLNVYVLFLSSAKTQVNKIKIITQMNYI